MFGCVRRKGIPPRRQAFWCQCKRQKEKVGKVVVKALWADVQHEKASPGLIVTTSRLSPGAKEVCAARLSGGSGGT